MTFIRRKLRDEKGIGPLVLALAVVGAIAIVGLIAR